MNPEIFKHIECHTGNDLETIGFEATFENYYISFYGKQEDNYNLVVESFAENIADEWWEESIPSENYKNIMQKIIDDKLLEVFKGEEEIEEEEFDGDYYKLYDLRAEMFY